MKTIKGYSYLVKVRDYDAKSKWFSVIQTGQRSWNGTLFSEPISYQSIAMPLVIEGNSSNVMERFNEIDLYGNAEIHTFDNANAKEWRKAMFQIMKRGDIE